MNDLEFQQKERPRLREPFRVAWALNAIAGRLFRRVFGRHALRYLISRIHEEPSAMTTMLLNHLGRPFDPEVTWLHLALLAHVPNKVFLEPWVSLDTHVFETLPGESIPDKIFQLQMTLVTVFGLHDVVAWEARCSPQERI